MKELPEIVKVTETKYKYVIHHRTAEGAQVRSTFRTKEDAQAFIDSKDPADIIKADYIPIQVTRKEIVSE
jgi:hypothetical protein